MALETATIAPEGTTGLPTAALAGPPSPAPELGVPWPEQRAFIMSGAPFKRYQGGRGSGKTKAGVYECRRYAWRLPGATVLAVAPTYRNLEDYVKPEFDRQFLAAGENKHVNWHASRIRYVLPNGSQILLRQCDEPEKLRGLEAAAIWMDEASLSRSGRQAFEVLLPCNRQIGYPHVFMFTGTPQGKNWLHWLFTPGDRPQEAPLCISELTGERAETFVSGTLQNPYLDDEFRRSVIAAAPPGTRKYRQEILGEVVVWEGLVYDMFDSAVHIAPRERPLVVAIAGVDWGWTNPGVILMVGMDVDGYLWVGPELYATKQDPQQWWVQRAHEMMKVHNISAFYCDPSDPQTIDSWHRQGLPAVKANNEIAPGIAAVGGALAQKRLKFDADCTNTFRELGMYVWKQTRDGLTRKDEPEDADNHCMDALRYAVMGLLYAPMRRVQRIVNPVRL